MLSANLLERNLTISCSFFESQMCEIGLLTSIVHEPILLLVHAWPYCVYYI